MDELYKKLSKYSFSSLCRKKAAQDAESVNFLIKHKFHNNRKEETLCISRTDDGLTLTDQGSTMANLDKPIVFLQPEFTDNVIRISEKYKMRKEGDAFIYDIDPSADVAPQIMRYLQGVHFMYTLKLFYENC